MDALNSLITVPSWAYSFCYYFLVLAVLLAGLSLWSVLELILMPSSLRKSLPMMSMILRIVLNGAVAVVLFMMNFWICRSALKPVVKEKFAVRCSGTGDCLAVMGTQPEGSLCSCGGRGLCGGCVMNNNMEPQGEFMPFSEGFATKKMGRVRRMDPVKKSA